MNLERLSKDILKQNEDIELFNHDTIESIAQMILCEALELVEATKEAGVNDDLTSVASEAADCLYLIIRMFDLLEIDERAVDLKLERNEKKYGGKKSVKQAINDWEKAGGDAKFFNDYLDK